MSLGFQTDPHGRPGGTAENSPAFQRTFQRWVWTPEGLSPEGTADSAPIQPSLRGLKLQTSFPALKRALKRWAILIHPSGMNRIKS
jgi:hypothetical protein